MACTRTFARFADSSYVTCRTYGRTVHFRWTRNHRVRMSRHPRIGSRDRDRERARIRRLGDRGEAKKKHRGFVFPNGSGKEGGERRGEALGSAFRDTKGSRRASTSRARADRTPVRAVAETSSRSPVSPGRSPLVQDFSSRRRRLPWRTPPPRSSVSYPREIERDDRAIRRYLRSVTRRWVV